MIGPNIKGAAPGSHRFLTEICFLSLSPHCTLTSQPVTSSIRASFGGRAGSEQAPKSSCKWGEGPVGVSESSPIFGFCRLTAASVRRPLMRLYLQPVLLSQVCETVAHSSLNLPHLGPSSSSSSSWPPCPLPSFYAIPLHWTGKKRVRGKEEDPQEREPRCLEPVVTL